MGRNPIRAIVVLTTIALALPPPNAFAKSTPIVHLEATNFSTAQLDAMLAPIALYPDELLTLTLMASTYPLQVVTAHVGLRRTITKA